MCLWRCVVWGIREKSPVLVMVMHLKVWSDIKCQRAARFHAELRLFQTGFQVIAVRAGIFPVVFLWVVNILHPKNAAWAFGLLWCSLCFWTIKKKKNLEWKRKKSVVFFSSCSNWYIKKCSLCYGEEFTKKTTTLLFFCSPKSPENGQNWGLHPAKLLLCPQVSTEECVNN